jgi:hypothetical protein
MRTLLTMMTAAVVLTGCITTQEMPLAPNVVRLDTQSRGFLFTGQTVPQTMRAAAKATLDRGYTHFRLEGVGMGQGSQVAGVVVSGNGSFATATPVNAPTANVGATVVMFHANEPGAQGAFEAQQVLQQYSQ